MNESLIEVLNTSGHPYGFRFDWIARQRIALEEAANRRSCSRLTSLDVTQAMSCPGMWRATQEKQEGEGKVRAISRQTLLTRQMARMWGIEATRGATVPFLYVEACLNDPFWMTESQAEWIGTQTFEERIELIGEISAVLSRLQGQIPFNDRTAAVHVGLEWSEVEVGRLTLVSDDVDFRVRTCEIDGEGAWARTVLLGLVPEKPTQGDLESLGFSAAMHTISTGCPPARVAAYGLLDGKLTSLDIDADWIGLQVGYIMATLKVIEGLQTEESTPLTPGRYCAFCPAREECPLSQIGLEEF